SVSTAVASADSAKSKMQKLFLEYREAQRDALIDVKQEEVRFLKGELLQPSVWLPKLTNVVEEAYKKAAENHQWLESDTSKAKIPDWITKERKACLEDARFYGQRAIEMARAKSQAE